MVRTCLAVICASLSLACSASPTRENVQDQDPIGTATPGTDEDALNSGRWWRVSVRPLTAGDEFVVTHAAAQNTSSEEVVIRDVRLKGLRGFDDVAHVRRIEVGPSGPDVPPRPAPPPRWYVTYPPVYWQQRECLVQDVSPLQGYRVGPGERFALLIWIQVRGPGRFRIEAEEVEYVVGGRTLTHTIPVVLRGISEQGGDFPFEHAERKCAHLAKVLPGAGV